MARAVVILAALSAGGCRTSDPPGFRVNLENRERDEMGLMQREAVAETMEELFGTPDEPSVPEGVDLDLALLGMAAGPLGRFEDDRGRPIRQRGLYRQHCAVCHGISGDGAGPAASVLEPYPRDFRNGLFKYTSTIAGTKPTTADLERTLLRGIPGTAMPSFAQLDPREIQALVEYVKYLSIRGETELYLIEQVVSEYFVVPLGTFEEEELGEYAATMTWAWTLPEQNPEEYRVAPPKPPPTNTPQQLAASIARGRTIYASEEAQCVKCHGPEGAGDGEETELYDDWNKPKVGVTPEQTEELARLFTLPLQRLRARNFREGTFRGGNRPEDVYLRVHIGLNGTPMAGVGPRPGVVGALTPEEIWHVVHYVRSLAEGSEGTMIDE